MGLHCQGKRVEWAGGWGGWCAWNAVFMRRRPACTVHFGSSSSGPPTTPLSRSVTLSFYQLVFSANAFPHLNSLLLDEIEVKNDRILRHENSFSLKTL